MHGRRATAIAVTVITLVGTAAAAQAGTVGLTLTTDSATLTRNAAVTFRGQVVGHGWTYVGTLAGTGKTWSYNSSLANLPILSMTSGDGTVAGTCVGSSETADQTTNAVIDMSFGCVLSRNGGTPWEVVLDSALQQLNASGYDDGTWSGTYGQATAPTPLVNAGHTPTYGQIQLGDAESGGAIQYGPLRFSGQIAIGASLFRGDLVSGTSAWVQSSDIPPVAVSGSSDGQTVSGTCSGTPDDVLGQGSSGDLFTCSLSVGSAAPVTVLLNSVYTGRFGGCSYRDCWGDSAGLFTAG